MELGIDVRRWVGAGRSRQPVGLGGRKVALEKAKAVPIDRKSTTGKEGKKAFLTHTFPIGQLFMQENA